MGQQYLFFDLEFANSQKESYKIYEFGYVIVDEDFNIIKTDNFTINPDISRREWDWYVLRKILHRDIKEYENALTFDKYYNQIKEMITTSSFVFGHTLMHDAKGLNDECKRYQLPSIDYDFYDVKVIYKNTSENSKEASLIGILKELNIVTEYDHHDAQMDALNTMLILKELKKLSNLTIEEMISNSPNAYDSSKDFKIKSYEEYKIRKEKEMKIKMEEEKKRITEAGKENTMFGKSIEFSLFTAFVENLKNTQKQPQTLKDMKVSISINYEQQHYKQMLNIVKMIVDRGGKYQNKSSETDIFVTYDLFDENDEKRRCSRLQHAEKAILDGANIKIIDFVSFLEMFNITEEELDEMPIPSFDFLYEDDVIIKNEFLKRYFSK